MGASFSKSSHVKFPIDVSKFAYTPGFNFGFSCANAAGTESSIAKISDVVIRFLIRTLLHQSILPRGRYQHSPAFCKPCAIYRNLLYLRRIRLALMSPLGLANQVLPTSELRSTSEVLAKKIMVHAPQAVRFCMQAVHPGIGCKRRRSSESMKPGYSGCVMQPKRRGMNQSIPLDKRVRDFKGR
jgi:hypothetical protein